MDQKRLKIDYNNTNNNNNDNDNDNDNDTANDNRWKNNIKSDNDDDDDDDDNDWQLRIVNGIYNKFLSELVCGGGGFENCRKHWEGSH